MPLHINLLPESVLLKIFSVLAEQRICNLFRLRLVCQRWKNLSYDSSLWEKISFPSNLYINYKVLERILSWTRHPKEVHLSSCPKVDDQCAELIAKNCPKLEILNLRNCQISQNFFTAIPRSFKNLKKLILSIRYDDDSVVSTGFGELFVSCKELEEVCFYKHEEDPTHEETISMEIALSQSVVENFATSRTLRKLHCENVVFAQEYRNSFHEGNIFSSGCENTTLVELGLPRCTCLNNQSLFNIGKRFPCLKAIDVSYCPGISDNGVIALAEFCPQLQDVNVTACQSITDIAIECLAKTCKSLQALCVAGSELPRPMGNITDVAIQSVADNCLKLAELNVRWCQGVTDTGIGAIAANCPNLSYLNVNGCLAISDVCMLIVAAFSKNLQTLNITECLRITSESVNAVVQNCTKLKHLDMQVCSYITQLDFRPDDHHFLSLQHIDLSYCTKITDECIKHFSSACRNLSYISLAGCRNITDVGVKYIAQNCPSLQYFDASFRGSQSNERLSIDSLMTLARKCHQLCYVDLIGCWCMTHECVSTFIKHCLYLSQLSISLQTNNEDTNLGRLVKPYRSCYDVLRVSRQTRGSNTGESLIINMSALTL